MRLNLIKKIIFQIKKRVTRFICKRTIHVIGDSHTEVFSYLQFSPKFAWFTKYKVLTVHGATASGLDNPNSKTNAKNKFENYIKQEVRTSDYVLFQLGEVDCGFVIWYKVEKGKAKLNEQLDLALENYYQLIDLAASFCNNKVIITSAILPTIKDNQNWGDIANLRKSISATQVERTNLTLKFNNHLKKYAEFNNFLFIDLDSEILDTKTGLVKDKYLNEDRLNHHLSNKKLSNFINRKIKSALKKHEFQTKD